jgi:hypothetical protein
MLHHEHKWRHHDHARHHVFVLYECGVQLPGKLRQLADIMELPPDVLVLS